MKHTKEAIFLALDLCKSNIVLENESWIVLASNNQHHQKALFKKAVAFDKNCLSKDSNPMWFVIDHDKYIHVAPHDSEIMRTLKEMASCTIS